MKLDEARAEASYKLSSKEDVWKYPFPLPAFNGLSIELVDSITRGFLLQNS